MSTARADRLIAHRGTPLALPENTLAGVESAVACGARFVEVDIQITADRVPILYHDADWQRISGAPGRVVDTPLADAQSWGAPAIDRFGSQFQGTPLTTLHALMQAATHWPPHVRLFLEIKSQSLRHFDADTALGWIARAAGFDRHADRIAAVISFDDEALAQVRDRWRLPIGWVLPASCQAMQERAARLAPEFLFCHEQRLPAAPRDAWQGPWQWAVYPVNEPAAAERLFASAWDLIETDDLRRLRRHFQENP